MVSINKGCRLFQTSGPQTEKACLTSWVLVLVNLVVDNCRRHRDKVVQAQKRRMMWKMLCTVIVAFNIIWNIIGSQMSRCGAGVTWDCRLRPRTSRVGGALWTRWREEIVDAESPTSTELQ